MVSSTVDHMVAITVFLAATLLFIGLFNQTIQTAVIYQRHRATATKASDLLDNMLLSPGIPWDWGQTDVDPTGFGLQDPEFTQYKLSPYSLMRLRSFSGDPVYYDITGQWYSNVSVGGRDFMLIPYDLALDYSTAARLMGINNSYGFQLTLTPIVTVSIEETQLPGSTLKLDVEVSGVGFPLSYATLSYCFLKVGTKGNDPYYDISFDTAIADATGSRSINIDDVDEDDSYAFIVYAREGGLVGMGFYQRTHDNEDFIVPFVDSFEEAKVLLAHSYNVHLDSHPEATVFFNATYVLLTEDFTLREMPVVANNFKVVYGSGTDQTFANLTISTHNPGILIVSYKTLGSNYDGVVLMPWGLGSLSFPVTFGGDQSQQEWVATDMRQVTVGGIAYQAQIAVWSLEGYQVVG